MSCVGRHVEAFDAVVGVKRKGHHRVASHIEAGSPRRCPKRRLQLYATLTRHFVLLRLSPELEATSRAKLEHL